MINVVFFGSNSYSVIILEKLLTLPGYSVTRVVTKPDSPMGRGQKIYANPVSQYVTQHTRLLLLQPNNFTPDFIEKFSQLKPDLAICVAYGPPFFTSKMCQIPRLGIINLHPSPLPRYRGAAPGPWQIIHHETQSALTIFKIDEKPDHGPIIQSLPFPILNTDTSHDLYLRAFSLAANHLLTILNNYVSHPDQLQPQNHNLKSYYPKLSKESGKIDWSKDPVYLEAFIRAMQPWPQAWCEIADHKGNFLIMKILSSQVINHNLILESVQISGKKPTTWDQVKTYYRIIK